MVHEVLGTRSLSMDGCLTMTTSQQYLTLFEGNPKEYSISFLVLHHKRGSLVPTRKKETVKIADFIRSTWVELYYAELLGLFDYRKRTLFREEKRCSSSLLQFRRCQVQKVELGYELLCHYLIDLIGTLQQLFKKLKHLSETRSHPSINHRRKGIGQDETRIGSIKLDYSCISLTSSKLLTVQANIHPHYPIKIQKETFSRSLE